LPADPPSPDTLWRLSGEGPPAVRCWEGDYVVYNRRSGDTHVLDIVTGEVIRALMAGEARSGELCRRVSEFLEVPNDAEVSDLVDRILTALDELGLIEPANGC
jgi:PqqD family protein of HPr-rel-A system